MPIGNNNYCFGIENKRTSDYISIIDLEYNKEEEKLNVRPSSFIK